MSVFAQHPALAVCFIWIAAVALVGWVLAFLACEHARKTREMVRKLDDIVYRHLVQSHGYPKKEALGLIFPSPENTDVH